MRLAWLFGSLTIALLLAVATLQTPRPVGSGAEPTAFSAARAMVDVREIARHPHPVGSLDHARVSDYLISRMTALGLTPTIQDGPLSPTAIRRLNRQGQNPAAAGYSVANLVGVLPGRDPSAPAVMLMAHYDTVPDSPGAADDTTGVAAILEAVRAIRARGPADRNLVVVFTDAEELDLDGARVFFGGHPLRDRIGAVVNLDSRGGGGRAIMFETGRGNAETIAVYGRAARRATGGPSSSSLAVFIYEHMPNGSDFTIAKARGIQGINLAFIGRPGQYHTAAATPDRLDQGTVQHIGAQALETADALLRAPALPAASSNRVYSDILGWFVLSHSPAVGWLLLGLTATLTGLATWRARRETDLTFTDIARGGLDGLWLLTVGIVLTQAVRTLAGPMAGGAGKADAYYILMARLPWMEAATALTMLAVALLLLSGRRQVDRRLITAITVVAAGVAITLGGFNPVFLMVSLIAIGLGWLSNWAPKRTWGGWLGVITLILGLAFAVQIFAPEAALVFVWTALPAALAAAITAFVDPFMLKRAALVPAAVVTVVIGAWLFGLAHFGFLSVGMDMPGILALVGLLVFMLIRPLTPATDTTRPILIAAAVCLVVACGVSGAARFAEPAAAIETPTAAA